MRWAVIPSLSPRIPVPYLSTEGNFFQCFYSSDTYFFFFLLKNILLLTHAPSQGKVSFCGRDGKAVLKEGSRGSLLWPLTRLPGLPGPAMQKLLGGDP